MNFILLKIIMLNMKGFLLVDFWKLVEFLIFIIFNGSFNLFEMVYIFFYWDLKVCMKEFY